MKNLSPHLPLVILILATGCSSTSEPKSKNMREPTFSDSSSSADVMPRRRSSAQFGETLVTSISNNPLTSATVEHQQVSDYSMDLQSKENPTEPDLLDALAAARLAGGNTTEVVQQAKKLMALRIRRSQKDLPDLAKLEIGLTAIQEKNLARAKIFLDPLLRSSKKVSVIAAINNAYGIAALQLGQTTVAVQYFKKALSRSSSYAPALFNLGMLALKHGHYKTASKYLSVLPNNWYASLGLVSANRHMKRNSQVKDLCSQLLRSQNNNKVVLFNCGLFYLQNLGDKNQARELMEKATQQPGGEAYWDEVAFEIMEKLQ